MAARHNHARELRTIGQQLDKQGIDIFDLRHLDGDYVVDCGDPNPPFVDLIHLRYSAFEVRSLDLMAAKARSTGFTRVDFQSVAETLRAIGRYLEKLDAKLLRISAPDSVVDGSVLKIEYQTRDGRYRAEDKLVDDLAELAMHMYKERSPIGGGSRERHSSH